MSMSHAIAWIFETLLRLVLPSSGHHRAADSADRGPAIGHRVVPTLSLPRELRTSAWWPRAERRLQRRRRAALWLALHGLDVGPRVIHGVRVVAW
jgi:hypothetical protein